jgi:hypothetical protein
MNRLAKTLIAVQGTALVGLGSFTTVVLVTEPAAPVEQTCPMWAAEAGLTDVQSYEQCNRLWNAGYDTLSITRDEYEWNVEDYKYVFGEDA